MDLLKSFFNINIVENYGKRLELSVRNLIVRNTDFHKSNWTWRLQISVVSLYHFAYWKTEMLAGKLCMIYEVKIQFNIWFGKVALDMKSSRAYNIHTVPRLAYQSYLLIKLYWIYDIIVYRRNAITRQYFASNQQVFNTIYKNVSIYHKDSSILLKLSMG